MTFNINDVTAEFVYKLQAVCKLTTAIAAVGCGLRSQTFLSVRTAHSAYSPHPQPTALTADCGLWAALASAVSAARSCFCCGAAAGSVEAEASKQKRRSRSVDDIGLLLIRYRIDIG